MRKGILESRKAAMELSIGTIVIIVLGVSMLIVGIFLIQRIRQSAVNVIDMTDAQLENEINKLFAEDKKLVIYPSNREIEIEHGESNGVGIGIKNLQEGVEGAQGFSYEVIVSNTGKCVETAEQIANWIDQGQAESGIPIPVGELSSQKVLMTVPTGASICTVRFRVNVLVGDTNYATDFFDVKIVA